MIPKRIHQIWLGPKGLPAKFAGWAQSWREKHPEWGYRLWRDEDLPPLVNQRIFERIGSIVPAPLRYGIQADLVRYELLAAFGGLYVDVDNECLRPIDDLLMGQSFVVAIEPQFEDRIPNDFIASRPGHPLLWDLIRSLPANAEVLEQQYTEGGLDRVDLLGMAGPRHFAKVLRAKSYPDVTILPFALIHPCRRWLKEGAEDYMGVAYVRNHFEPALGMWGALERQAGDQEAAKVNRALPDGVAIAPNRLFIRAEGLEITEAAEGYVIYDRARDRIHCLNHSAVVVLELCNGKATAAELPAFLQAVYDLPSPPEGEVIQCLQKLFGEGLIR